MAKTPSPISGDVVSNSRPGEAVQSAEDPFIVTTPPDTSDAPAQSPVLGLGSKEVMKSQPSEQAHTPTSSLDLPTQCASYALEMMSHAGVRHHVIGASIVDEKITLQYYNHSAILYSEPLNFVAEFPRFLSVLLRLMLLGHKDWGFADLSPSPTFKIPQENAGRRKPFLSLFNGKSLRVKEQLYILEDIIHQQHGIIGRGTCVIGAKSDQSVAAVVKFSWPASGRMPERDFIERARDHDKNNDMDNHLPKVLAHAVEDHWAKPGSKCEPRQLQIMVFNKLTPVTQLTDAKDLVDAIRGIFKCSCCLFIAWGCELTRN